MGQDGEMLRNSGGSWVKFASNNPNEADASKNLSLYSERYFLGNWAGGSAGQLLRAADGTYGVYATGNRSRPLNKVHPVYTRLGSGNWAAGAGTSLARNVGGGWALLAAHDIMYPESKPLALYGAADFAGQAATYLGDDCVGSGQRAANASGPFGGAPLQLQGDRWRSGQYTLYCGGGSRVDFRPFDTISFFIKWCDDVDCVGEGGVSPLNTSFQVTTWNAASREVQLHDYMEGPLNGTWQQVTIPLADLVTDTYDMSIVDHIRWPTMQGGV